MWSKQQVKAEEAKKVRVVDSQDCSGMVTVETWPDRQMWLDKEEGSLVGLTEAQENRLVGNMVPLVHLAMGRQAQTEEIPIILDRPRQCPSPEQSLVYRPRVRHASVHSLKGGSSLEKFYQLKWVWAVSLNNGNMI